MANNYIPGFTPSLHGRPVKRMAIGGRMESGRWFNERDDLGDTQNTLSNIDANSVPANYNNIVAPTAADTYQPTAAQPTAAAPVDYSNYDFGNFDLGAFSQPYSSPAASYSFPTPQPVQTAPYTPDTSAYSPFDYDQYNIGNYGAQSYAAPSYQSQPTPQPVQTAPYYGDYSYDPYNIGDFDLSPYQSQPTAAQLAARDLELTKPGVASAQWDPQANAFMYTQTPMKVTEPTGPYYVDPGEFDPVYGPNTSGNYGALNNAAMQTGAQMGALPAAQAGATPAAISASSPPPGTTWGVYSNPNDPTSLYTVKFVGDKSVPLTVAKDTPVFLYDNKTKQVLASGVGPEGANAVAAAVYKMNTDPSYKNAWWDIYTGPAGATDPSQFKAVVTDPRNKNFGQRFVSAMGSILPIAVQFIPGLGQASLAAKIAAGAAAGGAGAALKGQDILRGAVLGGATSGVFNAPILNGGKTLSGVVGSAVGKVPIVGDTLRKVSNLTGGGSSAIPGEIVVRAGTAKPLVDAAAASLLGSGAFLPDYSGLSKFADPSYTGGSDGGGGYSGSTGALEDAGNFITVAGKRIPTSNFTNAVNAASGALSGINYGDQIGERPAAQDAAVREPGSNEYDPANQEIVVKSGKYKVPFDAGSTLNKFLNADYMGTPDYTGYEDLIDKYNNMYDIEYPYDDEGWTVEGAKKLPRVIPPTAALPDLFDPLNSVDIPTDLVKEWPDFAPKEPENEIVVNGYPPRAPDLLPVFFPPLNSVDIPPADTFKPSDSNKSILDEIKKYADLARLAATGLAPLFGGGGGGGAGGYAGMRGPLNAIFSAKLPAPNMQQATPRSMAGTDWYRYGYGPEQSFFSNVPQGAPNTSMAYTGYETSPRYNAGQQYVADLAALLNSPQTAAVAQSTTSQTTATQPATTQAAAPRPADTARSSSGALSNVAASQSSTATSIPHTPGAPIPGLSKAQQLYYDRIATGPTIDKAQYDYVKGLSDYQALASLSNYDSLLGSAIYNGPNGFRTMDELEAYYNTPLYTYGGDILRKSNLPGYAEGGKVRETLSYDDLTPEEKNFVDYHRRNMAVNPLEQDGYLTTVYGMIDPVGGGEMLHPGYVHGRIMGRDAATDWATHSGIDFPVYPDAATAIKREQRIHRDIIEPDTERYQRGDRAWLEGYAEGGYAVGGPGDGRDDKIPAMLSDGEYVMDAETVALLGNGSPKAGADMLDKFRVNVRKHKGRDLAKGKFSANAKKPEQYLKGRK